MQSDAQALAAKYPRSVVYLFQSDGEKISGAAIVSSIGPTSNPSEQLALMAQLLHQYQSLVERVAKQMRLPEQEIRQRVYNLINTARLGPES